MTSASALQVRLERAQASHAQALLSVQRGELEQAAQQMEAAMQGNPNEASYARNAGEVYRRLGRPERAVLLGKRAVGLAPEDADAHHNLALALSDQGALAPAIDSCRAAVHLRPTHHLAWNNLGALLEKNGETDAAMRAYQQALAIAPGHAQALCNAGALHARAGRTEAAVQAFDAAIQAQPGLLDAHFNISQMKRYVRGDPQLPHIDALHRQRHLFSAVDRVRLCFATAKAWDDVGDVDRAFAAYDEGNRLHAAAHPMDEATAARLVADIAQVFDAGWLQQHSGTGAAPDSGVVPIFIVGMPRSGTSLIEQVLASHPDVFGAGELQDLPQAIEAVMGRSVAECMAEWMAAGQAPSAEQTSRIGQTYLRALAARAHGRRYVVDKMPANFLYLGLIHLALPQARVVHAMRDPMDSCFSCYTRLFRQTMEFTYDLHTLGRYYVRYAELMRHWAAVLPAGRVLDMPYESMVENFEAQARRLLGFIGLPWSDACLRFHETEREVLTASVHQVRRPIYRTSLARWEPFAAHLAPLHELVARYRPVGAAGVPPAGDPRTDDAAC